MHLQATQSSPLRAVILHNGALLGTRMNGDESFSVHESFEWTSSLVLFFACLSRHVASI